MAPDAATWSTLLAGWVRFAQSAVSLPDNASGQAWKASVAPAIGLHANAMALGELNTLNPDERALAMDTSELAIKQHTKELNQAWGGEPMPEALLELIDDARVSWECSLHEGVVWLCGSDRFTTRHPGEIGLALRGSGFEGEVYIASPGTDMFEGAPVAWCRGRSGGMPEEDVVTLIHEFLATCDGKAGEPVLMRPIHQVYRQFDFLKGGPVKDLAAPLVGEVPPGQPLLVPIIAGGEVGAVPLPHRGGARLEPVSLEWLSDEQDEAAQEK